MVGRWFTAVLDADWQRVLDWKWNSLIPLVFACVVLTKTLGAPKARETQASINRRLDLWERGIHAGLVEDALEKGRARVGCVNRREENEKDYLACIFLSTLLLRKLRQAVRWATNREGGVFSQGMFAQRPGERLRTSFRRNNLTCMYLAWKIPHAWSSRITMRCRRL